jgi:hypothetical protein
VVPDVAKDIAAFVCKAQSLEDAGRIISHPITVSYPRTLDSKA